MGNAFSRNPNMCASCSSLTDGMEESDAPEVALRDENRFAVDEQPADIRKAA
jgi:hypothetical protein